MESQRKKVGIFAIADEITPGKSRLEIEQQLTQAENLIRLVAGMEHCINEPERLRAMFAHVGAYLERKEKEK